MRSLGNFDYAFWKLKEDGRTSYQASDAAHNLNLLIIDSSHRDHNGIVIVMHCY